MPIDTVSLAIPEIKLITTQKIGDHRGQFTEVYSQRGFSEIGLDDVFVQDNHSWSSRKGTLRGLHYQAPPFAQGKLVRVVRGRIFDVAVDIRGSSPHFGKWVGAELSAENRRQIWIPTGFAHGFCTLEDDTEVIYKVNAYYSQAHDRGLMWNDPAIGIDWPVAEAEAILSDKDRTHPRLADLAPPFA
jgi:dTDP-4-dehydrorhamnose 3,5-epimerase